MAPSTPEATPPESLGKVVGENLKRHREYRRMTQHELARHLQRNGIRWTRSQVAAFEAGNRAAVDATLLVLLAASLGLTVQSLLEGEGQIILAEGVEQSRRGFRESLAGAMQDVLDYPDRVQVSDPDALKIRSLDFAALQGQEADAALAKRLDVDVRAVIATARVLFEGRSLTEERDRRVSALETGEAQPMTIGEQQAHRGHITRELSELIEKTLKDQEPNPPK